MIFCYSYILLAEKIKVHIKINLAAQRRLGREERRKGRREGRVR